MKQGCEGAERRWHELRLRNREGIDDGKGDSKVGLPPLYLVHQLSGSLLSWYPWSRDTPLVPSFSQASRQEKVATRKPSVLAKA